MSLHHWLMSCVDRNWRYWIILILFLNMIVSDPIKLKEIQYVTSDEIFNHALITTVAEEYSKCALKAEESLSEQERYVVNLYRKLSAINDCVKSLECSFLFIDKMFSFKFPMLSKISKGQYINPLGGPVAFCGNTFH